MYGPFLRTNLRLLKYSLRVIAVLRRLCEMIRTNQNAPNITTGIEEITTIASKVSIDLISKISKYERILEEILQQLSLYNQTVPQSSDF